MNWAMMGKGYNITNLLTKCKSIKNVKNRLQEDKIVG